MAAHTIRRKPAKGSPLPSRRDKPPTDYRIMATLPKEDFEVLSWWAAKHQRPLTEELRRAVWAYIHAVRADFPGNKEVAQ